MPNRRIYTSAIASIVAVICVITIQCSYASYAAAAEPQHTYTVSDDVQVEKTHAPSLSEAPFTYGPQTRSFNSVASPSITKNLTGLSTVGVEWKQHNDVAAPSIRLRYLNDGAWSTWISLSPASDNTKDSSPMQYTDPVYVGKASQVEAQFVAQPGTLSSFSDIALVAIDTGYTLSSSTNQSASSTSKNIAEPIADRSKTTSATQPVTGAIHTREEWWVNGNPAMDWEPEYGSWQGAIGHHTVNVNDYSQAEVPAIINGIYVFHSTGRGWGDIGYNLIVDRYGGIWEGRDEGVPRQVKPASQVIGAQAKTFNSATFGVAVLGNFTNDSPSNQAVQSVAAAIAWEFNALGISDPNGTFDYHGTQQRISGHGDSSHWVDSANRTQCPGVELSNQISNIRNLVSAYMLPQIQLTWQIRQEDIAVGAAIYGATASLEYKWTSYNVDTGTWKLIADWNGGNWAGWSDNKGTYWLRAEARNAQTKELVAEKTIAFAYAPGSKRINGTFSGWQGNRVLLGMSSDAQNVSYQMKIYDVSRGTWIAGFRSQWAYWKPSKGIYWTHYELYTSTGKLVDTRTYAFGV